MISRAKRALPGMVMSLLLSAPALAAPTHDGKDSRLKVDTKTAAAGQKVVGIQHSVSAKAPAAKSRQVANRARTPARSRMRDAAPALTVGAQKGIIQRAHFGGTGALIDDGTLWRESGSMATWQQTGVASWYGGKQWQGHRTSSGDRFDEHALTAAHATLPMGTKVRVVRHDGARSVIVTINDRPGTRTRIIDLSREAAKELGILDSGVAMVTLQPL